MRKLASIINSPFVDVVNNARAFAKAPVINAHEHVESPIEAQFLMHVSRYDFIIAQERGLKLADAKDISRARPESVFCFNQVWIDDYRSDFLFVRRPFALVVELDGHEWHYDSIQRVKADNARLASFAKNRVFIMRFLGTEVWHECQEAVARVIEFFETP